MSNKDFNLIVRNDNGFDEIPISDFSKLIDKERVITLEIPNITTDESEIEMLQLNNFVLVQIKKGSTKHNIDEYVIDNNFSGSVVIFNLNNLGIEVYTSSEIVETVNGELYKINTGLTYNKNTNKLYIYLNNTFDFTGRITIK